MVKLNKILFPTDFSLFSESALPHIARLVPLFKGELHIINALRPGSRMSAGDFQEEIETIVANIGSMTEEREATNFRIHTAQMTGIAPAPAIIEYCEKQGIDLIIMATHGRRGIPRFFLGSVAEEVARLAPCSVLTIKAPISVERPAYRTILVPFDFSSYSNSALNYAVLLARVFKSKLDILHVLEDHRHSVLWVTGRKSLLDLAPNGEKSVRKAMKKLAANLDWDDIDLHIRKGHFPTEIQREVNESNVDMIVIPTHGLTGKEHSEMGSISQMVIHYATCPVFTLRAFDKPLLR